MLESVVRSAQLVLRYLPRIGDPVEGLVKARRNPVRPELELRDKVSATFSTAPSGQGGDARLAPAFRSRQGSRPKVVVDTDPRSAMPPARKPFRIERGLARSATAALLGAAPVRTSACSPADSESCHRRVDLDRLSAELNAMREAISATKYAVADLQRSPAGSAGIQRAADELDAVSAATESATTRILAAVEEIELSANVLRSSGGGHPGDAADVILDRVLVLYEACNFQDITGQRIRKVVGTLKFVEERLDRMIAAWGRAAPPSPLPAPPARSAALLVGPCLPGEPGHVSQSDVDAFFS